MTNAKASIQSPSSQTIYYRGPALDRGPLPALFYFALSGQESLHQDPYNQPASFLADAAMRIFSFNLPAHNFGDNPAKAMEMWAKEIAQGHNFIAEFVRTSIDNIHYLIAQKIVDPEKIAVSGLSRGGFIAAHIAAEEPKVRYLLGYAPLTSLKVLTEFKPIENSPLVEKLSLAHIADKLIHKHTRFYIGNRDIRVGSDTCYECIRTFTEAAYNQGLRSPQVELIISPSIGHKGHGTSPTVFQEGVRWIRANFAL